MNPSRATTAAAIGLSTLFALACTGEPLPEPRDVSGNFDVVYQDNLRVYVGDALVADVESGENETVETPDGAFEITDICGDGKECPSEQWARSIGVEQPWGTENRLLNFIHIDTERAGAGGRVGGLLEGNGTFAMLAGLDAGSNQDCAAIGVATIEGTFTEANDAIEGGKIIIGWGAGCRLGDIVLASSLRLETDFTATRTGDLDLSAVTPEPAIDEEGDPLEGEGGDTGEAEDSGGT